MKVARGTLILVDTNVIIEAHRCRVWQPLANAYALNTVEKCVEETQTGFQNRRPEETIDQKTLASSLRHIAPVKDPARAALLARHNSATNLDDGERDLLAYAMPLTGDFFVASPDLAAMRTAMEMGWGDRLISLEEMVTPLGVKFASPLKRNYTFAWLSQERTKLMFASELKSNT